MKGIVFTEFLEMVEGKFSPELADRIVDAAGLASGGVYTTVGTYNHVEMIKLVSCLSKETGIDTPDLMRVFGEYLFGRFYVLYPKYFDGIDSSFSQGSKTTSTSRSASCTPKPSCHPSGATRPGPDGCVSPTSPLDRSPPSRRV